MTPDGCRRIGAKDLNDLCRGRRTAAAFFDYTPRGLEGVLLLFDKLRADGWLCLILFEERYRGKICDWGHQFRVSRDELKEMEEVDLFFVLDDAAYAYPEKSRVVAMFHSIDLVMAGPGMARHLNGFCQPSRFADYLLIPYANMAELDREDLAPLFTGIYPPEMQLRDHVFTLVPGGYMNIEALAERIRHIVPDAIAYTPTAGFVGGCLNEAERMVELLLASFPARPVIYRPHPKDVDAPENLKINGRFADNPRFSYDREPTDRTTLGRALVLVTDTSGIALTFSGARSRPVVYARLAAERDSLREIPLGYEAQGEEAVVAAVSSLLENPEGRAKMVAETMNGLLYNPNSACTYLAAMAEAMRTDEKVPGWIRLKPRTLDIECSPQGVARYVEEQLAALADGPVKSCKALYRSICALFLDSEESVLWDFTRHCFERGVNMAGLKHITAHFSRRFLGDERIGADLWLLRQIYCIPNGYVWENERLRRISAREEVALFLDASEPFAIMGAGDAYREYYRGPLLRFRPSGFAGFLDDSALGQGRNAVDGYPVHAEAASPGIRHYLLASYDQPAAFARLERLFAAGA